MKLATLSTSLLAPTTTTTATPKTATTNILPSPIPSPGHSIRPWNNQPFVPVAPPAYSAESFHWNHVGPRAANEYDHYEYILSQGENDEFKLNQLNERALVISSIHVDDTEGQVPVQDEDRNSRESAATPATSAASHVAQPSRSIGPGVPLPILGWSSLAPSAYRDEEVVEQEEHLDGGKERALNICRPDGS